MTDIADAMMIRQLFAGLWGRGAVVVATSNRHPEHLYHKGLQREAFLPFIAQLEERTHVHSLEESSTDYRLLKVRGYLLCRRGGALEAEKIGRRQLLALHCISGHYTLFSDRSIDGSVEDYCCSFNCKCKAVPWKYVPQTLLKSRLL